MTIFCIYFFIPASCNSSSLGFTLVPRTLDEDFGRQHVKPSKYPFLTPGGEIFLTQDPSDFGHDQTLYNVGRITYKKPLSFKDKSGHLLSFNSFFTFNITTVTKYNEYGDGIAFVLTIDKSPPDNSTGRFLGLISETLNHRDQRFMAIEFDTFQNLQEEIMDPSASHIGIYVSSLSTSTTTTQSLPG
ncbi:hypothetical protein GOP47_0011290 [Adiantum capillus-veneris]|uniref:Legume lectin domain-containing protein n=1 Tax=Adiantum capillus-veneris TaxID=13818 RepID=A0A9D4USY4_ADICA|nr:hypothetical protein GOP47_0011290 [Adiantum capillus-veneris]